MTPRETMTSRERLLRAVNHQVPDRVPIDLGGNQTDILNPVQTSARDMEPCELKRKFGDRLAFWGGGCNAQHILPTATPQQVADDVRRNMELFKAGGGYVFNSIHRMHEKRSQPHVDSSNSFT